MTETSGFADAQRVIGRLWREDQSTGQERILRLARDAMVFISNTGQQYPFLDFQDSHVPRSSLLVYEEGASELKEDLRGAELFFESLLDDPATADERTPIQTLLDVLHFIGSTRQVGPLRDYLQRVDSHAPPLVLKAFETKEQAEDWLRNHPNPPCSGDILIGERYHDVVYDRETRFRGLPWNRRFERYLGELARTDPPVAQASFDTRESAEAWLRGQSHPSLRTWVLIAGEFYLAVYHPNIDHRALYPLSMALKPVDA